jgi:guanine deaminase
MPGDHERFMELALAEAGRGMRRGDGGPFGACIVHRGKVVARGHNRVLLTGNPTQHAEVVAICRASRKLATHVLDECTIYSTTEPCVMCFAAIHWARIKTIHFGTTIADVKRLGFNELTVSNIVLKRLARSRVALHPGLLRDDCRKLLIDWKALPNRRTY